MNFNFNTKGMLLEERYQLLTMIEMIPIGTKCYKSGDFAEYTSEIIVTEENQKIVTMFWNALYFLEKEKAEIVTWQEHAEYGAWQANCCEY